jgi:hypothetical protein
MSPSAQAQILEKRKKGNTFRQCQDERYPVEGAPLLGTVVAVAVVDSLLDTVVVSQHGDLSLVVTYDCRIGRTLIHQGSLANNKNILESCAIPLPKIT